MTFLSFLIDCVLIGKIRYILLLMQMLKDVPHPRTGSNIIFSGGGGGCLCTC